MPTHLAVAPGMALAGWVLAAAPGVYALHMHNVMHQSSYLYDVRAPAVLIIYDIIIYDISAPAVLARCPAVQASAVDAAPHLPPPGVFALLVRAGAVPPGTRPAPHQPRLHMMLYT